MLLYGCSSEYDAKGNSPGIFCLSQPGRLYFRWAKRFSAHSHALIASRASQNSNNVSLDHNMRYD